MSVERNESPRQAAADPMRSMTVLLVYLGSLAILVMVVATVVDVVGRLVFGTSLVGTYDIVQLSLVVAVYAGMAEASRQGAHIAVDLIDRVVGERLGRILRIAAGGMTLCVFLALAVLSIGEGIDAYRLGDTTADLAIPKTWHWAAIVVGLLATSVALLQALVDTLRGDRVPETSNRNAGTIR